MKRQITFITALLVAFGAGAQSRKPQPDEPDTRGVQIEEAHRTSPENKPENKEQGKEETATGRSADASTGSSRSRADTPDTRGLEIDEAHRTSTENKPKRHSDSR